MLLIFRTNYLVYTPASAWVANEKYDKVLMVHHHIYDSWSWLDGHAASKTDLLEVPVREAIEESGIKVIGPVIEDVFLIEVLILVGYIYNEVSYTSEYYVPSRDF